MSSVLMEGMPMSKESLVLRFSSSDENILKVVNFLASQTDGRSYSKISSPKFSDFCCLKQILESELH